MTKPKPESTLATDLELYQEIVTLAEKVRAHLEPVDIKDFDLINDLVELGEALTKAGVPVYEPGKEPSHG